MTDDAPLPATPAEGAHLIDARGLRCPQPVLELAAAIEGLAVGHQVELWADDPAAKVDVPVWCRMRRQQLRSLDEFGSAMRFRVERAD